jgi:glycerol-3-phosphate dehydrogenase
MDREQKQYERYLKNMNTMRNNHLLKNYGIDSKKYEEILETQKGLCDICQNKNKNEHNLAVDHCMYTGKVRGLLCRRCNSGLGYFKHNVNIMKKVIEYLEKHNAFALPILTQEMKEESLRILQEMREKRKNSLK